MPNLTAADMASRPMRKGWVDRTDKEDEQIAAEDAREAASKRTGGRRGRAKMEDAADAEEMGRHADMINAANTQRAAEKRRRSPLYDKSEED